MQNSLEGQRPKIYLPGAAGNVHPGVYTHLHSRFVQKSVTASSWSWKYVWNSMFTNHHCWDWRINTRKWKRNQECGWKKLDFSHSNLLRELEMSLPLCFCFWWIIGNDYASWSHLKHNYNRLFCNTWNETHITNIFVQHVMCRLFDYVWAASRKIYCNFITERYLFMSYMMSHHFIVWL